MARVVHFELPVDDPERAAAFYREAFGWKIDKWDGPVDYYLVNTGEGEMGINGGLTKRQPHFEHTVNTIGVGSLDEAVKKVEQAGGKIVAPKMPIPGMGWLAYCQDTEGNDFGMMEPDESAM